MGARKTKLFRKDMPILEELGEQLPRKAIAARLGMLRKDFDKALKDTPNAELRLERGEARREAKLVESLMNKAKDSKSPVHEFFLLKTLHGYNDNPRPEPVAATGTVNLILPGPMSAEQFRKAIAPPETVEAEVVNDD